MPSEVIIPSFVVIVLLIISSIYVVSALSNITSMLADALRAYNDNLAKLNNKVKIIDVNATLIDNDTLYVFLLIENQGENPIYKMSECDLIVEYTALSGDIVSTRLKYGTEWRVISIIIAGNYIVPFEERRVIGGSEIGVIEAVFKAADIDLSKPFRIVFASQYGVRDYKWVIISA